MSDDFTLTYEIYVLRSGRWELHGSYEYEENEKCLDEAKRLYKSGRHEQVRVVEDTYDPATKTHEEDILYCSPRRPKPKRAAPQGNAAPMKARRKAEEKKPALKRPPSEIARGIPKLAGIGVTSLAVAALVSYAVLLAMRAMQDVTASLGEGTAQALLIALFLATAIALFIPLMRRFGPSLRAAPVAAPAKPAPLAANPPALPQDLPEPPPLSAEYAGEAAADDSSDEAVDDAPGAADEEPEEEEAETPVAAETGALGTDLLKFIGDSLEPLAAAGRPLDAFNRFGLTLFFSGAAEYLAARDGVPHAALQDVLAAKLQMLGHAPEMARGFCANIDEYLVNPKYFRMYEEGRSAIVRSADDPDGDTGATAAMDFWNEPAVAGETHAKEFVAVLFTDIVGSTAITQARGDDAAQLVVHAHNRVVRDTLALFGGREIKHTGDGIMATFPQTTDAVDGAVAIQQACQRANAEDPELGLGICIGINAGEPIHEGGDIFGTPVQMAARVLGQAEGGEIAVSAIVHEMCRGKDYALAKKGDFELKGFDEPVPIYLIEWQAPAAAEAAAPEAAA